MDNRTQDASDFVCDHSYLTTMIRWKGLECLGITPDHANHAILLDISPYKRKGTHEVSASSLRSFSISALPPASAKDKAV